MSALPSERDNKKSLKTKLIKKNGKKVPMRLFFLTKIHFLDARLTTSNTLKLSSFNHSATVFNIYHKNTNWSMYDEHNKIYII